MRRSPFVLAAAAAAADALPSTPRHLGLRFRQGGSSAGSSVYACCFTRSFTSSSRTETRSYAGQRRSPHAVLGISAGSTPDMIKARFRALAKVHHPDAQPREDAAQLAAAARMAELIEAYDALMDDGLAARMQDSAVASSCETYTLEELADGGLHDLYELRLVLESSLLEAPLGSPSPPSATAAVAAGRLDAAESPDACAIAGDELAVAPRYGAQVGGGVALPTFADLDDSVLDLKRMLQQENGQAWGLVGRPRDRQGLAAGWELVFNGSVLSYHLFLRDYGINNGDTLHAVIRRSTS